MHNANTYNGQFISNTDARSGKIHNTKYEKYTCVKGIATQKVEGCAM